MADGFSLVSVILFFPICFGLNNGSNGSEGSILRARRIYRRILVVRQGAMDIRTALGLFLDLISKRCLYTNEQLTRCQKVANHSPVGPRSLPRILVQVPAVMDKATPTASTSKSQGTGKRRRCITTACRPCRSRKTKVSEGVETPSSTSKFLRRYLRVHSPDNSI
jgi:hypothetical protein